jgi:endoglucanase
MRRIRPIIGIAVLALAAVGTAVASAPADAAVAGLVRVDQVGYLPGDAKVGYLMAPGPVDGATFSVLDASGHTVLTGPVGGTSRGSWNAQYPDVYPITFTALTRPGRYRIRVGGSAAGTSPDFVIGDPDALYGGLVADGVAFFEAQRDGRDVIGGALGRRPSHLNDATAKVYALPHFEPDGSDVITDADLTRIGGPVDVAGGWFDAGDYLKFTHTTAYGAATLLVAQRALGPAAPSTLDVEARYGVRWLDKMWDQATRTLYLQVGVGSGNSAGTFLGDHDLWREPQADDGDTDPADRYAAAHRPVFRAAPPGAKISPNLVGRVSAAFALAAQVDAGRNPGRALSEYRAATSLYAMADTASPPSPLVTAVPVDYYPEDTWRDDMEFGAAELALAAQRLGRDARGYLSDAARFAAGYIAEDTGDTLNLYDTSALGHADLLRAMAAAGNPRGLAVSRAALVADLKRQVGTGATRAASDVFHAGGVYTDFDVDAHTFGLIAAEALYRQASGDTSFDAFASQQRDWLFGANAWGASFMVGAGTSDPACMQHQVSNLAGTPALGAVVNGPNDPAQFEGGLGDYQDGMVPCPAGGADRYAAFSGHGSRYVDDVRSWQSSEPALDMTGSAILGLALQQAFGAGASRPATGAGAGAPLDAPAQHDQDGIASG